MGLTAIARERNPPPFTQTVYPQEEVVTGKLPGTCNVEMVSEMVTQAAACKFHGTASSVLIMSLFFTYTWSTFRVKERTISERLVLLFVSSFKVTGREV